MKKKPTQSLERTRKGNQRIRRLVGDAISFNEKLQTELFVAMSAARCDEEFAADRRRLHAPHTGGGAGYDDAKISSGHVGRAVLSRAARPGSSKKPRSIKTATRNSKKAF